MQNLTNRIRGWATERNLHAADPDKQLLKVGEEFGEVCGAKAKGRREELELEIGDVYVALTILAMQEGMSIERCVQLAYDKMQHRNGKMVNGIYVKECDLP